MTNMGGGGGDLVARLDRSWPALLIGALLVVVALVWSRQRRNHGRAEPLVALAPVALVVMGAGTIAISVLLRDLVVGRWVVGRPIRRRGRTLLPAPSRDEVETEGGAWLEAAGHEAAAVVAFTDLAARLGRVGAPSELIERCREAARDEARHTRLCGRLARHYGASTPTTTLARTRAAGHPRERRKRRGRREIVRLAVESFVDGVVGEGFAAARLEQGARTIAEPWAADILRSIAADERRHAALGADIVSWCQGQAARPVNVALRWSASRMPIAVNAPKSHEGCAPLILKRCGLLDQSAGQRVWAGTRGEAISWLSRRLF